MKKNKFVWGAFLILGLFLSFLTIPFTTIAEKGYELFGFGDADIPAFLEGEDTGMDKEEYRRLRSEQIALYRGMGSGDPADNIESRNSAIGEMKKQEADVKAMRPSPQRDALLAAWTPIGPDPIPNGQTQVVSTPVSGRVTAIAVHPTIPNTVYVGTAQGGVYRSLDGGATWTPLMDNALSLAIGAVTISPSQPETVYVGTGEGNFSSDSYFGVGVYRIDNASTTATLSGPLGGTQFTGRGISEIIVHPTNPAMIWVASTSAAAAINGGAIPPTSANRGIYRSDNATAAVPTFAQLPNPVANQNLSVRDIAIDPLNPDLLVANVVANGGGIVVYNNATVSPATSAVGVQRVTFTSTSTSELTAELAIQHTVGAAQPTIYAATGNLGGRVLRSTDGGVTFTQQIDNNFCSPQCFYDIAVAVDPNDPNRLYIGGAPTIVFAFSINGGTTFVESETGLHVDSHVITVAPSNPNIIYFGSDGGIYRSETQGLAWTPRNTAGFLATQFMGLDTHPTDPNITIGGTQDNGTNRYTSAGEWTNTDFGDGGYSVIDQSSTSTAAYNQYHTYFNASNLTAYAFTTNPAATPGSWTVRGCNGGAPNDGITCTPTINFYAPLERGPGTPNTIYYGADRLYRSIDTGNNHTTESQTFTSPVSAIGISPQNDNVRIIGQNNGGIFGTTTGANPLVDLDPAPSQVPAAFVTRTVIDPTNVNTAYVTLALFNAPQIYRTTNLNAAAPTWTPISGAATGLPLVPVNAFLARNTSNGTILFAGTDIGVYASMNGGNNWMPFGTGLPRIAVFDLAVAPGNILRAATHGKGIYQIPILQAPTAATVNAGGRVATSTGRAIAGTIVTLTDSQGTVRRTTTSTFGYFNFADVAAGETHIFTVKNKKYLFSQSSQVLNIDGETNNIDFVGTLSSEKSR